MKNKRILCRFKIDTIYYLCYLSLAICATANCLRSWAMATQCAPSRSKVKVHLKVKIQSLANKLLLLFTRQSLHCSSQAKNVSVHERDGVSRV